MNILDLIVFILAVILILAGLVFYIIQFIGIFRFKYVLNRMHAAAIGDTLGCGLMMLGTMLLYGASMETLKIICIEIFLWLTAPVSSHMLAKLEVFSKKTPDECSPVVTAESLSSDKKEGEN